MARRNGTTLIVTVLHCTSLQEVTSGEKLLNWGFAMDGKVRPVGGLVSPLPAVTTSHLARHPSARRADNRKTAAGAAVASSALPMAPLAAAGCLAFATGLGGALLCGVAAPLGRGEEADPVPDGGHGRAGHLPGPGRAVGEHPVELRLVGEHLLGPLPDRGERVDHHLGQVLLERAVAGAGVPLLQVRHAGRRSAPSRSAAGW